MSKPDFFAVVSVACFAVVIGKILYDAWREWNGENR